MPVNREVLDMTQTDLFVHTLTMGEDGFETHTVHRARRSDPASSKIAAEEIKETAESQCARILAAVQAHPDLTTQELAPFVHLSVHTVGRRLPELRTKGLVTNPYYGDGRDAMQLRRCTVQNRLALSWRAV